MEIYGWNKISTINIVNFMLNCITLRTRFREHATSLVPTFVVGYTTAEMTALCATGEATLGTGG